MIVYHLRTLFEFCRWYIRIYTQILCVLGIPLYCIRTRQEIQHGWTFGLIEKEKEKYLCSAFGCGDGILTVVQRPLRRAFAVIVIIVAIYRYDRTIACGRSGTDRQ